MLWHNRTDTPRTGAEFEAEILGGNPVVVEGSTNAAVTAAIAELDGGGVVRMPPGEYTFTGTVNVPQGVHILAYGAVIDHTANGVAFSLRHAEAFSVEPRGSVRGFVLNGNSGAAAIGVDIGNSWGAMVIDAHIEGYTSGRAIREFNDDNWAEGTVLANLMIRGNAVGIELARDGGTESFAYQRWRNVAIQVPADGVGIDFGGASATECYVYNCDLDAVLWLEGDDAVGVRVRAVANVADSRFNITGEQTGGFTGRLGIENLGGNLVGYGRVAINSATDDLSAGETIIRPYPQVLDAGDVNDGVNYRQAITSNKDNRYSAQFGVGVGTGIDLAWVAGYGGGGEDVFRVLSVPFEGDPSTASKVLAVGSGGWVELHTGAIIQSGTGDPEGVVTAPVGSLFLRTDGGASTTLYVKTSGAGNTGWAAK